MGEMKNLNKETLRFLEKIEFANFFGAIDALRKVEIRSLWDTKEDELFIDFYNGGERPITICVGKKYFFNALKELENKNISKQGG